MRKIIMTIALCALLWMCRAAGALAWEIGADNKLGVGTYSEEHGTVQSDWLSFYYEGLLSIGRYPEEGLIGGADIGIFLSASADEDWELSGARFQSNDMNFWGIENNLELGYVAPFLVDKVPIAPIIGYGWSFTRFKREDFSLSGVTFSTEAKEEDIWVHHVDAGFRMTFLTHQEDLKVNLRGIFGLIVYSQAHTDAANTTIKGGNGSHLIKVDVDIDYAITEYLTLVFGGFVGLQHLEGSSNDNIVWPDNDLNTYGGTMGIRYIF